MVKTSFEAAVAWIGSRQSPTNWITTSGELYGGHQEQQIEPSVSLNVGAGDREHESLAGGHVVSLWEHTAKRGETALQFFYDDQSRHELATYFRSRTLDLDYQDHLPLGPRHDLVWGAELRFTGDSVRAIVPVTTLPHYKNELADAFAQDEIVLLPQKLVLTLGSKIQVGTLAGFQIQPSARILWAPKETQSLWAAVSRAAVAPSVQDKDINFPLYGGIENGLPVFAQLVGDPHFRAETVLAYEVGYRRRVGSKLTVDVATFLNRYDRMQSLLSGAPYPVPTPSPHIELQRSYTNGYRANSGGVEATLSWKPIPSFSFQGSYAWMQSHATQTEVGQITLVDSWSSPHNTVSGSASWTFIPQWTANSFVSYVTTLPPVYVASNSAGSVSAYTRLDANLGRMLGKSFEFKVGGTNLLSPRHFEFGGETGFVVPSEARRSLFLNVSWTF